MRAKLFHENRHSHGNTTGHLLHDETLVAICDFRIDLQATIHRPRMHDNGIGWKSRRTRFAQPELRRVVAGDRAATLELDTQHHGRIKDGNGLIKVVADADLSATFAVEVVG